LEEMGTGLSVELLGVHRSSRPRSGFAQRISDPES